jgi:hypothetical protein
MGVINHRVDGKLEQARRTVSSGLYKDKPDQSPNKNDARTTSSSTVSGRDGDQPESEDNCHQDK